MLAHLAGRRFIGPRDARPNLYLIALAGSGVGKDFPRTLNRRIALLENMSATVRNDTMSGQGLEDALVITPTLFFQMDEFDTVRGSWKTILSAMSQYSYQVAVRRARLEPVEEGVLQLVYANARDALIGGREELL